MKNLLFIFLISISFTQWGVKNQITERYENGKPKVVLKLKGSGLNEIMLGKETFYKNGKLRSKSTYNSKGEKDGKWVKYIINSDLKNIPDFNVYFLHYEKNYKNGLLDGLSLIYQERTGYPYQKKNYKKGKLDGEYIRYCNIHPKKCKEMINVIGHYKNGYKSGVWNYYHCTSAHDGDCSTTIYKTEKYKLGELIEKNEY
jgi:hypothetical protein